MNGDVDDGQASFGSGAGASRFLIGLVTCFAKHDGIPAGARAAWLPTGAEVATTQQRHRATAGEHLVVQRLRVLPVDPVAGAAQAREVGQMLRRSGSAGHL